MMASRGMGAVSPSKMPKGKKTARRDNTDFTQFAKGGAVGKAKKTRLAQKQAECCNG